jgi:penicillin-binding protein 2
MRIRKITVLLLFVISAVSGQQANESATKLGSDASVTGLKNARVMSLAIPAPRGQILDRNGEPLAQSRVVSQLSIQFPQFEKVDRSFVVSWARLRLDEAKVLLPNTQNKSDDEIWAHYKDRRWLPFYISGVLSSDEAQTIQKKISHRDDLLLFPVYARTYPEAELAAHIIGYTGSEGKLPIGPINQNDPLWEMIEGKSGLEFIYNKELSGSPGLKRIIYNNEGQKLQEELVRRSKAGGNIVTTLDLKWQKSAENVLADGCRRGAFVVIDVTTGEVLVMASRPSFDLSEFVGGISSARFKELNENESSPLFGRAFSAQYPPASTFKAVVALAAVNDGTITEETEIDAPASIDFPGHKIRNASGKAEGRISLKYAMARSTNTWFAQVGINCQANNFLAVARRLGYGEKTGLPLMGEGSGLMPTNEWMEQYHKRKFTSGDAANMAIGQGVLLATPLQVAQGMAGIANGNALPKLQLIRQVQDSNGRVLKQAIPGVRTELKMSEEAVNAVRGGMYDVVNAGYGTGKQAALSWTDLCGKTGTAQWGPNSKNQRLAWFAGFFPRKNPRFAFAVIYEGRPEEKVSGGRMAAPMVRRFFNSVRSDIEEIISEPKKAKAVEVEEEEISPRKVTSDKSLEEVEVSPLKAEVVEEVLLEDESNQQQQEPADRPEESQDPQQESVPEERYFRDPLENQ